ncbi:MAG TPA: hypothetical protein VGI11_00975 [Variovorax sp.]|jgi:hypothetical protein
MVTLRQPLWVRHAWWLPALCSLLAGVLAVAAFRLTSEENILLTAAILGALPWSLLLLALDLGPGFAGRAALVVSAGLCVNAGLLWWATALLRSRFSRNDAAQESEWAERS